MQICLLNGKNQFVFFDGDSILPNKSGITYFISISFIFLVLLLIKAQKIKAYLRDTKSNLSEGIVLNFQCSLL